MDTFEVAAMLTAMRTIVDQLEDAAPGPARRMQLKDAAFVAGISEAQMRRRCEQNRYGKPGGYGYRIGGRWQVVIAPFVNSLPVSALLRVKEAITRGCAI
ncbi:stalled ribosome alternative rescue factor ArfA [Bradyrhizobium sp. USDA 4341]